MPDWRIGTIGFGYSDWQDVFYPPEVKAAEYLAFYSKHFDTLELDTTFHAVPTPERIRRWAEAVPEGFRFCVKTPKDVTHGQPPLISRLRPMLDFLDVVRGFGEKLGPVLLQFPPSFDTGDGRDLEKFLDALPADLRYAVELRHGSWNVSLTEEILRDHGCCWVAADSFDEPWPLRATTDFLYVRWIGEHGRFPTLDRERLDTSGRLAWWKGLVDDVARRDVQTVWGLVNNDYSGFAVATANRMRKLVGLPVRIPEDPRQGLLF